MINTPERDEVVRTLKLMYPARKFPFPHRETAAVKQAIRVLSNMTKYETDKLFQAVVATAVLPR